ncbi:CelD/BcsL family acetyltransferase involved in cellulose biosynthesis [Azospirillum lipoferum]|uniref:GNAT family N-acetyltransferase n=1 Tax=Azospirillum lipoferum TaxID=193 RepID=A0A5A9GFH5_AZOLI|nr:MULTISPECIES: GNAT family N-acetyltransferase [Azospirillum]KAA0592565.1 GNAT family N-acetyltransferase [Azospirillum lipoferum]MCP1614446.1 CelD/BcsL family acetyltransferase involved in cellulose biosynthesis [Azospirillum lipoferum]MDW5532722.1 GNAT family N-acetyltransferase [Azospirillum sp. NL1]
MSIWPRTDSAPPDSDGTLPQRATGPVPPTEIRIALHPLPSIPELARAWTELEGRSDSSFFLSWSWIGPWLAQMPDGIEPQLLVAFQGDELVGLAVLCPRLRRRFGLLSSRCWMLHETGDRSYDRLFMEYNGILADRRIADEVTDTMLYWLDERLTANDELVLGGLTPAAERAARRVAARTGHTLQLRIADSAQWVDLGIVRAAGGDFRGGLGRNTRAAVNRSERLYRARGALEHRVATNVDEALEFFAGLEVLHQAGWQARGQGGAFANAAFRPFHQRLIAEGIPRGAVRLSRISAGGQAIGYLYNFIHRNRVLNYQGGFAFEADNRLKPGLLSHVLAIEDALARGEDCYDFMSTPAGHKPLLSNAEQPMNWLTLGPDRFSRRMEAHCRRARGLMADAVKRSLRGWIAPAKGI